MIENFIDRFVPSKDEREFLKDKSVTFSDVEQAEIIINHECLKIQRKTGSARVERNHIR
ncbi:MAG: hypothetical protein ACLUZ6_04900 [Lachnospira eligens]